MSAWRTGVGDQNELRLSSPSLVESIFMTGGVMRGILPIKEVAHKFNLATTIVGIVIELFSVIHQIDCGAKGSIIRMVENIGTK